ncbi:MAG: hypothetical protein ACP5I1_20460 [Candidatus Hinthialibacter sp.]
MKVARDDEFLYFYAQTVLPISPKIGTHWMRLFIQVDHPGANSRQDWQGWRYLVQPASSESDSPLALKHYQAGNWETIGFLNYHCEEREMAVRIPRNMLGIRAGDEDINLRFKWSDNMQEFDPLDWIVNGDAAPNGRFQYRYRAN